MYCKDKKDLKGNKALLVLENGTNFGGKPIGYERKAEREIIFNISMT